MHIVFIYGTLKRSFINHDEWMKPFTYIADASTHNKFPLIVGGAYYSPILLNEAGAGHIVKGELFEVDDSGLSILDQIEGVGKSNGYKRISVEVISGDVISHAWSYVKDRATIDTIHNELNGEYLPDERYIPAALR